MSFFLSSFNKIVTLCIYGFFMNSHEDTIRDCTEMNFSFLHDFYYAYIVLHSGIVLVY